MIMKRSRMRVSRVAAILSPLPWCIAAGCSLTIWTCTLLEWVLLGEHVYRPASLSIAFWISKRLEVTGPFSVTKLIPPLGESKLIALWSWIQTIVDGGSGAYLTRHVRFIVLSLLMNISGPPAISVTGSTTVRYTEYPMGGVVDIWHS